MKRQLINIVICYILILLVLFSLVACTACTSDDNSDVIVNVSNDENLSYDKFGHFITIGNNLVYDAATQIVYIDNYTYAEKEVYTPYYAPNGLPYRYNPETNTFEEIAD